MGGPKALLPVAGTTLAAWQLNRLGREFGEVLVSALPGLSPPPGVRAIADLREGRQGPLAGIEAGLAAASRDALVVVACDLPRVEPATLARLVAAADGHDAAAPRVGGRPEPVCACYRKRALRAIAGRLTAGRNDVAGALGDLDVAWLDDLAPAQFWNLNNQEDYQVFLSVV